MNLLLFIISYVSYLQHVECKQEIYPTNNGNLINLGLNTALHSRKTDKENHHLKKRATYEEEFDEFFDQYFDESNHVLIGTKVQIYTADVNKDEIEYNISDNAKHLINILNPDTAPFVPPPTPYYEEKKIPTHMYPRITLILDSDFYDKFDGDTTKVVEYAVNFWTGVDLHLRQLTSPRFRLNIKRIVIATSKDATPYVIEKKGNLINMDKTLDAMYETFFNHAVLRYGTLFNADRSIFILMTMKRGKEKLGLSIQGNMCIKGFSIVHDRGDYLGVLTAVHEMGHVLGAVHDSDEKCLMSKKTSSSSHGVNRILFSDKSKKDIIASTTRPEADCFLNAPDIGIPLNLKLPGTVFNYAEQCKSLFGEQAVPDLSISGDNLCSTLRCVHDFKILRDLLGCHSTVPLDGTLCGHNDSKVEKCIRGKCLAEY